MADDDTKNAAGGNDATSVSGSDGSKVKADLDEANQKIQELTEAAKRALADLQNYRKKVEEEKAGFVLFANAALLKELLPILDNFARAFSAVPENIAASEWFKGALAIEQQLAQVMRKQGLKEAPSALGNKLDVRMHEAVALGPGEKDIVTEEYEKGYILGDKVIRPAKVKVGDGSQAPISQSPPDQQKAA